MRYKERHTEIVNLLQQEKRVLVSELSKSFAVSEVTIRKDLQELEQMGLCRRFHSGAASIDQTAFDVPVRQKETENRQQKQQIAKAAVEMLGSCNSIILDAGSTAHFIARFLPRNKKLRVVTNSLLVGAELGEFSNIDLLLTGGNVRHESQALIGPIALASLSKVNVDIAFIGAMGVSARNGFTSATILEAQGKEAMLLAARKKVVVADHSKLNKAAFAPFARIDEVDMLITDYGAPAQAVSELKAAGLNCILA